MLPFLSFGDDYGFTRVNTEIPRAGWCTSLWQTSAPPDLPYSDISGTAQQVPQGGLLEVLLFLSVVRGRAAFTRAMKTPVLNVPWVT